jgi:hypothetical protein
VGSTKANKQAARDEAVKKQMGQPRKFKTELEFQESFIRYLTFCNNQDPKRIPNIAGYCVFNDITRDTYYKQEEYYSDSFAKTRMALEDAIVNIKDTIRSIFLSKVYFNYRDSDPPQSLISVNYNNVSDKQLESWLKDAGLKLDAPNDTE